MFDDHCRAFIARSPFLFVASCDADGNMDVSPRGEPTAGTTAEIARFIASETAKLKKLIEDTGMRVE